MPDYRCYEFTKRERALFFGLYICAAAGLAMLFYKNIAFIVIAVPFVNRSEKSLLCSVTERRRRELLEQFKDFLFMLSTSIGAGRGMKDAIGESVPGLEEIYGKDALLVKEMKQIFHRLEDGNENDVDVLMEMAVRTGMDDVIDFVTVYSVCKVTGASLIIALNRAASVIIDKMTIENEIRELVRRKKSEGALIFAMPVIVLVFLNICAPEYIDTLYSTFTGRIIMTFVIGMNFLIYQLIQHIVRVEI